MNFCGEKEKYFNNYSLWVKYYDTLSDDDKKSIQYHLQKLTHKPTISIIMPVYNTPENWLRKAIESVRAQLYPNWELCIADDASSSPYIKNVLEEYQSKDTRIKVIYRANNGHISLASNTALELSTGEYIGFLDHDDELSPHALYMVMREINRFPDAAILYSDEDKIDFNDNRFDPYFKPDWNPILFTAQNFINHFAIYKKQLVQQVNGFREGYEGSQDWDLAMRVCELISPNQIRHIPSILYHWRSIPGSTAFALTEKDYVREPQKKLLVSHFQRIDEEAEILQAPGGYWRVKYGLPTPPPLVTIIIPTRDETELLDRCIQSIFEKTSYKNYEVLIVGNQSIELNTNEYLTGISKGHHTTVIEYDFPDNLSAIYNFAAHHAKGEILLFLHNDIEVINLEWLDEMVQYAIRPEIGAVGALLYFPENLIQHAGIVLGLGGIAGNAYLRFPKGYWGQMGRGQLAQNYSAVTGACMAIQKNKFVELGGFNEIELPSTFYDIELCIRLLKTGYRNVWTPYAELYHYESPYHNLENTPEEQARYISEYNYIKNNWGDLLMTDLTYNPNLTLDRPDFSLAMPPRLEKPWREEI